MKSIERLEVVVKNKLQYAYVYTGHTLKLGSLRALESLVELTSRGVKCIHVGVIELANDARSNRAVRLEELRAEGLQQIEHIDYPEAEEALILDEEMNTIVKEVCEHEQDK